MRKLAAVVVTLLVATAPLALAGEAAQPAAAAAKAASHEVPGEILAMDLTKHTITLKSQDGKQLTLPVKGEAVATLSSKQVKPGDKVIATCEDDAQGKHTAVTRIKPVEA